MSLVLLGLEAALRVTGFVPETERAVRRMVDARWTTLLDCYPSNPRGYFDIDLRRPENDASASASSRRTASTRWPATTPGRSSPATTRCAFATRSSGPSRPGRLRVVVLGDSFAEGQGVKDDDTLARVLGRVLEARAPGRYEVRNCGRRGTDFPEIFEAFEDVLPYEPDLVVYTLTLNDAVQPPEFRARQTYLNDWILDRTNVPDDPDATTSFLRPRSVDFVRDRLEAVSAGRETTRWYTDMWGEANRAGRERTEQYIREMKRRLNLRQARLLVAPWPLFVGLDRGYPFEPAHETIRRFCASAGIAHHDLLPTFRGRPTADLWVHPVDRHPNEIAHRARRRGAPAHGPPARGPLTPVPRCGRARAGVGCARGAGQSARSPPIRPESRTTRDPPRLR